MSQDTSEPAAPLPHAEPLPVEPVEPAGSRLLRAGRWLLGAVTLVLGFTWTLLTATGPEAARDLSIGLVLVLGSLVMLMPHRVPLPRRATALAVAGVALLGTLGGLAVKSSQEACMFCYLVYRGWPFTWATRGGVADDPDTPKPIATTANRDVDLIHVAADLLFWGYLALTVMAVVVLVRRRRP